jgi:hypothetical protein
MAPDLVLTGAHAEPSAQPASISLEEYCAANPCRRNVKFQLRTNHDPINETVPMYWPAVLNDEISILPGEKLYIEATLDKQKLTSLKQVEAVSNPSKTLVIEFTQMDKSVGMMLVVNNPFQKLLKFHINMMDFSHKPHQTSSCPAVARGSAFESWPHPIPELSISDFHLLEETGDVSCVY